SSLLNHDNTKVCGKVYDNYTLWYLDSANNSQKLFLGEPNVVSSSILSLDEPILSKSDLNKIFLNGRHVEITKMLVEQKTQ
ncbi:MAG: hypothetical protein EBQ92_14285, partial [Proteobacteria bacterium]|nr:hypothetical protein [Pseudomonadota bacterium]